MPTPGVVKVRIGTDTQTNTPVKQVAFRFNGMSGPGPASSDQMLRVGNVHKHLKVLPWPVQDDKAGEYTKAQLDQMSVEARLTNPVGFLNVLSRHGKAAAAQEHAVFISNDEARV